ncbi:hypothetical protein Tco_0015187 [Tanacetum coccineum]
MKSHDLEKENNLIGCDAESTVNLDDMVNDHVNETIDQELGLNDQEQQVNNHVNETIDQEFRLNAQEQQVNNIVEPQEPTYTKEKALDSDRFGLGPLINKIGKEEAIKCSLTPEYPLGYSPNSKGDKHSSDSTYHHSEDNSIKQAGFSLIQRLKETIKVWRNSHLDFALSSTRGMSGGILCLWNNLVFHKSKILCRENFVVVDGLWIPSMLADLVASWNGVIVMMGDFNEVRGAGERFGLVFKERQVEAFNDFITNSSLIDTPLGGVVLGKGITDHRPIHLCENVVDYGPTPFWFFHSWLEMDGRVIREWFALNKSESTKLKKAHQEQISSIDFKVDQGCASKEDITTRNELIVGLNELHRIDTLDLAQKSKINPLSSDQRDLLECEFNREEIKRAVWDCGGDRAPGPDGFSFKFFTTFWDLLEEDVVRFVLELFHSSYFPKGCNSSFIALIPKVSVSANIMIFNLYDLFMFW